MITVPSKLTKALNAEDRKEFESEYRQAVNVLTRIRHYLQKEIDRSVEDAEKDEHYDIANWSLFQADNRGYRRGLREALHLIRGDDNG